MLKFCRWTKLYAFYRFLVRVTSWKKIDKVYFFFFFKYKDNWNWPKKVMLLEILVIVVMVIVCFILYELATMSPLGWHLPHLVDNTDTLYLGDQHWQTDFVVFFRFLHFCVHKFTNASVILCLWVYLQSISSLKKLIIKFPVTSQSKTSKNSD